MANQFTHRTLEQRFWDKVDKTGDCWEWKGTKRRGYGRFRFNGALTDAHRASWQLANGPIPEMEGTDHRGTCVLHKCDNRSCVRPDHLFIGTHNANVMDMIDKGRHHCCHGENNPDSKLTESEVNEIREHYDYGEFTQKEVAEYYGVS